MNDIAAAVVDDLTEAVCAVCGTRYELTRPNALTIDGVRYGIVVCTDCEQSGPVRLALGPRRADLNGRALQEETTQP